MKKQAYLLLQKYGTRDRETIEEIASIIGRHLYYEDETIDAAMEIMDLINKKYQDKLGKIYNILLEK